MIQRQATHQAPAGSCPSSLNAARSSQSLRVLLLPRALLVLVLLSVRS
jgi:hypothetical protein